MARKITCISQVITYISQVKKLTIFLLLSLTLCKAGELPETYMAFKYEVMNRPVVEKPEVSFMKTPTFKPMVILLATACVNHALIRYNTKHERFDAVKMRRRTLSVYLLGVSTSVVVYYSIEKKQASCGLM
jgi:hypothetical protein